MVRREDRQRIKSKPRRELRVCLLLKQSCGTPADLALGDASKMPWRMRAAEYFCPELKSLIISLLPPYSKHGMASRANTGVTAAPVPTYQRGSAEASFRPGHQAGKKQVLPVMVRRMEYGLLCLVKRLVEPQRCGDQRVLPDGRARAVHSRLGNRGPRLGRQVASMYLPRG